MAVYVFIRIHLKKYFVSRKLIKKGNRLSIKRVYLKNKIPRKQQYVPVQQKTILLILNPRLRMSIQIVSNFQIVFPAVKEKNNHAGVAATVFFRLMMGVVALPEVIFCLLEDVVAPPAAFVRLRRIS